MKREVLLPALRMLIRPLAKLCVRYSCTYQDFILATKDAFVSAAEEELGNSGHKVNVSRVSVITGLTRNDVAARYRQKDAEPKLNLLGRVLGQWQADARFVNKAGRPARLTCRGEGNQFQQLVHSVTQHANAAAVLFELERLELVRRDGDIVGLRTLEFRNDNDFEEGWAILARDLQCLVGAVEQNLATRAGYNHHIHTEYDRIPADREQDVRAWFVKEGLRFHRRARQFLARIDLDFRPSKKSYTDFSYLTVALGSFGFIEPRTRSSRAGGDSNPLRPSKTEKE